MALSICQVLPIRYGDRDTLEREMQDILGQGNFEITGFKLDQWNVKVSRMLTEGEISIIRERMRIHY
ncbi:hypothetical protein F4806DRAFT_479169 [Annulohypoxylon nitens]|nr:hypothetical protein F4806DRAFT_479169 [Annulohypoxylon nitens]